MRASNFFYYALLYNLKGVNLQWSSWIACSETCHSNPMTTPFQVRSFNCQLSQCNGPTIESQACNVQVGCPGSWGIWTEWSECSATCQLTSVQPQQFRSRVCFGGTFDKKCDGQKQITNQTCNTILCEGNILEWSSWSLCPIMCSDASTALRRRTRACVGYSTWDSSFKGCTGIKKLEEESCYGKFPCKGTYGNWENWSGCSESCQSNLNNSPSQYRVRLCVGDNQGGGCDGNKQETKNCNEKVPCPGTWGIWTAWGECSATCQMTSDQPQQFRDRVCSGGSFDQKCDGQKQISSQACNTILCEGEIQEWSAWNFCPELCSVALTAMRIRTRECVGYSTYAPKFLGCSGFKRSEEEKCYNTVPCKGTYGEWENWNTCSESCHSSIKNTPSQNRVRLCIGDNQGGGCDGNSHETRNCNSMVGCPGIVTEWNNWSECYKDCSTIDSITFRSRKRSCILYTFGGNCGSNMLLEYEHCDAYSACAGQTFHWEEWQPWSEWNCFSYDKDTNVGNCKCDRLRIRMCPVGNCIEDNSEVDTCFGNLKGDLCLSSSFYKKVPNHALGYKEKVFETWYLVLSLQLCRVFAFRLF